MTGRTKRFIYICGSSLALGISGCSFNQQSKFQTAFLPSTPHPAAVEIAEPPVLEPNPYLSDAQPAILVQRMPVAPSEADLLMLRADQAFQRGKKAYQANDTQQARREFDAAVDLMLEASEHNPPDRQAFEPGSTRWWMPSIATIWQGWERARRWTKPASRRRLWKIFCR